MLSNFTTQDLCGTLLALAIYPLFLFLPGYSLGWVLDLVSFRSRTPLLRLCLSIPLSLSLTPCLIYLIGRQFTVAAIWIFYILLAAIFLIIGVLSRGWPLRGAYPAEARKWGALIAAAWSAIAVFVLIDLQLGNRLYYSVVTFDYTVRSAVISALARTDSYPPSNPFFFLGKPSPFRYHYFWFLLCSLPDRLVSSLGVGGGIHPRHALIAGVIVIGLALLSVAALYLRFFSPAGARNIGQRVLIAAALLSVSGLDILLCLAKLALQVAFHKGSLYATVDWWNIDEVTGWVDSALWVPHHLAGLLACLMGFLILWNEPDRVPAQFRWQSILGAAACFASACGLSIYVTFVFAIFATAWCVFLLCRKQWRYLLSLAVAGILAGFLSLPFLLDLAHAGSAGLVEGEQSSFLRFGIRTFEPVVLLFTALHREHSLLLTLSNFVLLPVNYFLELGAFFVIGFLAFRQWRATKTPLSPAGLASVVALATTLVVCTFLRSNTIANNDLGMRGMLIAQFVLLIWGVELLAVIPLRRAGWILSCTLALGLCTNIYEVVSLRIFTVLADSSFYPGENHFFHQGSNLGRVTFDSREAYQWLDRHTPRTVVEQQYNTGEGDFSPGLYSNRQMANLDYSSAVSFGVSPAESARADAQIRPTFDLLGYDAADLCRVLPIDYLIARSGNPVWRDRSSWVWRDTPVFSNLNVRIYRCIGLTLSPSVKPPLLSPGPADKTVF